MSVQAQPLRVFVSGTGLDTNPCTTAQPCRTFQHAHDIAAANGEIDVLDPAGYGALMISKGISIQAHGFGGITQAAAGGNAIAIDVITGDPVTINGLLIDGGGIGQVGIWIRSGLSVQILNCVVRHFTFGIYEQTVNGGANLLIEDTIASDNSSVGIYVSVSVSIATVTATLNRITANNNNSFGIWSGGNSITTIANSVISNNSTIGLYNANGVASIAKTVISGNGTGVNVAGTVKSYGDNYINDNGTPVAGDLTPVTTQRRSAGASGIGGGQVFGDREP
jgi:hypothetical protein